MEITLYHRHSNQLHDITQINIPINHISFSGILRLLSKSRSNPARPIKPQLLHAYPIKPQLLLTQLNPNFCLPNHAPTPAFKVTRQLPPAYPITPQLPSHTLIPLIQTHPNSGLPKHTPTLAYPMAFQLKHPITLHRPHKHTTIQSISRHTSTHQMIQDPLDPLIHDPL